CQLCRGLLNPVFLIEQCSPRGRRVLGRADYFLTAEPLDESNDLSGFGNDGDVCHDVTCRFLYSYGTAEHSLAGRPEEANAVDGYRQRQHPIARRQLVDVTKSADDLEAGVQNGGMKQEFSLRASFRRQPY